jgi:hypothetical protein
MNYRLLTPALAEIREAATFYEGADFLDEVDAAVGCILEFPEAWGALAGNYRRCHLRRFSFSVNPG